MSARVVCSLLLAISCKITIQSTPSPSVQTSSNQSSCRVDWFESQAMPTGNLSTVRVFPLNTQYLPDDDRCPQFAVFEVGTLEFSQQFCPKNAKTYIRGMWLWNQEWSGRVQNEGEWKMDMPAEFVIPCDYARRRCNETMCRDDPEEKMQAFGDTARDFAVNLVEGSSGRHVCRDMFGHERIRPHGLVDACDFEVEVKANIISGAFQRLWTSSNYEDLIQQYDQTYVHDKNESSGGFTARWQSMMDTNERTDECVLNYGYRMLKPSGSRRRSISIEYNAYCACMKDLTKCEPHQEDPLLGICPRGATIHMTFYWGRVLESPITQTKFESKHPISILGEQPFNKECHAYILIDTRGTTTEVQIELGEHCPSQLLRDDDHGCHQFSSRCYGVRAKHMAIACCSWRYCNDPEDPHDPDCYNKTTEDGQSASGLMGAINAYLIDPGKPIFLPEKLVSRIGYCAYHSNMSQSVGAHDGPPDYCYTFVDLKWLRFVDIAIDLNFDLSPGERIVFTPDERHETHLYCTLFHGTAREYCPSITECTDGLGFETLVGSCPPVDEIHRTHTVVACRCDTNHAKPWEYCDEHVTVENVLWAAEMLLPQCYEGVLPYSENGTYDKKKLALSQGWNLLCYVHTFTNNSTGLKYRKYGFYDPSHEHFEEHRWMNCFPLNCTEDEDFCCCRTSKIPGEVCNDPEIDLWANFRVIRDALRVKAERRDPEGISLNDEEFEKCEGKKPWMHAPPIVSPQDLVTGFVGHDMCYFRQLPHELAQTDEDPENHTVRALYKPPMPAPDPLAAIVCDRERWTVRDWLDGCSCQLFRRPEDGIWEQYCCCIATKTETVHKAIWRIRFRHQLRTLGDFLYE